MLQGIAAKTPSDRTLDRSDAFAAAAATIAGWDRSDDAEDERLPILRAVARAEFGRRGYEATTIRDIAKAADMSVGSVYRLIGSKDELLDSIMRSFTVIARSGWSNVIRSDSTTVEKLDALTFYNETDNTKGALFGSLEALRVETELAGLLSGRIFGAGEIQSLGAIGITFRDDGRISFDPARLEQQFAADPAPA